MSGNGYREIRVIYPTKEGGDELPEDAILIVDGLAAKVFRALTEDYGVVLKPEAFTGGTKVLLGPGITDIGAGRLISKYLGAIEDADRAVASSCLTADVVYDGFSWWHQKLVPLVTHTRVELLDNIDNWRERAGGSIVYEIEEAFVAQAKGFVQFRLGPEKIACSSIYTFRDDGDGIKIAGISHAVPTHIKQRVINELSLTES